MDWTSTQMRTNVVQIDQLKTAQLMSLAYRIMRGGITRIYDTSVDTPPVLDMAEYFPEADRFVHNWRDIREDALGVAGDLDGDLKKVPQFHELMPEQYNLSGHGEKEWRMFVLRAYGLDITENMKQCPRLAALLTDKQQIKSASLSLLAPGKQVPTHTGPFRGITRFYMGLEVPTLDSGEPGVTLTIDGNSYRLGNGEAMLWDDTYPHSVSNDTDQWRIALLMDIYRANMSRPLQAFTNTIISLARLSIRWRGIFPEEFA